MESEKLKFGLNLLRKTATIFFVVFVLFISSCASMHDSVISKAPFYLGYDSGEIIRNQSKVATITATNCLEINGVYVSSKNMRAAGSSILTTSIVDLLPGEYKIKVTCDNSGKPIRMDDPLTYTFKAGHIYDVLIGINQVFIKENTSVGLAQKIAEKRDKAVFKNKK